MAMNKLKDGSVSLGSVKVGLPGSKSYHEKTPRKIKIAGETLLFVGGVVTFIAGIVNPPGWVVLIGGAATMSGRFIAKCFSNN